jgi:hypothetical protein
MRRSPRARNENKPWAVGARAVSRDVDGVRTPIMQTPARCDKCQNGEVQATRVFRHRTWLVVIGVALLLISSLVAGGGVYSVVVGLSPAAQNSSVNFAVFGGSVFLGISIPGLVAGVLLLRWRRVWKCGLCGSTSDTP